MSALIDCVFEKGFGSQASPASFTPSAGTVSASGIGANSNRVLIVQLSGNLAGGSAFAVTWNGVAMTQIAGPVSAAAFEVYLFALKGDANIATGNQALAVSWTGAALDITLGAFSIYNADQTTGWQNVATATGTSTAPSLAVSSANGNLAVVAGSNNNGAAPTIAAGNSAWIELALNGNYFAGYLASTTGTTTITWTTDSVAWAVAGVDVIAFSGGAASSLVTSRSSIPVPGPRRTQIVMV